MRKLLHTFIGLVGAGAMLAAGGARAAETVKRAPAPAAPAATVKPATSTPAPEATSDAEEVYVPEKVPVRGAPAPTPTTAAPSAPVPSATAGKAPAADTAPAVDPKAKPTKTKTSSDVLTKVALMPAPPLSPRFQQVRDRIEALLGHRSETPPKFDSRKSPFRPASGGPAALASTATTGGASPLSPTTSNGPVEAPASSANPAATGDLQLLQLATANLKVAGTIQINNVAHLVINQVPYKEGDVIIARAKGNAIYLRVKNISRYSYTLSLNETELSVKY